MLQKSKKHTKKIPDEIVKLIKEVEEIFDRFINFALNEKNKEKYYIIDGKRFKNLFKQWKNCTKKPSISLDDYYLTPEKINNGITEKKYDAKGAIQKSTSRIIRLLDEYFISGNDSSYQPNREIEIYLKPKGTGGMYRFEVIVDGENSIDLIARIKYLNESHSTDTRNDQPPHSDYDYMSKQLSDAERLLNDDKTILEAIRKYQSLILNFDEFHVEIIESIVHQIRIRSAYKGKISSVYPDFEYIDRPDVGVRNVEENLFKLLARNYRSFERFDRLFFNRLYFGRLDLRRINFSTKNSKSYENTLRYANFNGCNIGWTAFNNMDLTGANFANMKCATHAWFINTNLKDANFWKADLRFVNRDPVTGDFLTYNSLDPNTDEMVSKKFDPEVFLNVKTMYRAKLDDYLKDYLMKRKPSLFKP